jgi:hypothetical protein
MWPWTWLVRPQEGGKTISLSSPCLLGNVKAIGRCDFGQQGHTEEKTHAVEGAKVRAGDVGEGQDGRHDVLIMCPGQDRNFGGGVGDMERSMDSVKEAADRGEPCCR